MTEERRDWAVPIGLLFTAEHVKAKTRCVCTDGGGSPDRPHAPKQLCQHPLEPRASSELQTLFFSALQG
jgi:hypothetical protein